MSAFLSKNDIHFVLSRIPKDVVQMLKDDPRLFIAGGIIRALIAQEKPADIDVFGPSEAVLKATAEKMTNLRCGKGEQAKMHKTENAITVFSSGRLPLQFITRWVFADIKAVVDSFDFTVCQSAISYDPATNKFVSCCAPDFYPDLAARRLVYTSPKRTEDAGGSLLRVIKYIRRGYSIQVVSLGAVCSRLYGGIREDSQAAYDEEARSRVIAGLLREVDPLLIIDGIDIGEEDHHNADEAS